ncbi:YHYH domain-containing protein [Pseudomonas aeruginosa]
MPCPPPLPLPIARGGTDSKGCHTNHSTGAYHCH